MASKIVADPTVIREVLKYNRPIVYQQWGGLKDAITFFVFGTAADVEQLLPTFAEHPAIYYQIREDETYYYVFFLLFHPFDWANPIFKLFKKIMEHRFDTENFSFRIPKSNLKVRDCAAVAHNSVRFKRNAGIAVYCESQTHAIRNLHTTEFCDVILYWINNKCIANTKSTNSGIRKYDKYELVDLNQVTSDMWQRIKKTIKGGASIPHDQYDSFMLRKQVRPIHRKGDLFLRPEVMFDRATIQKLYE